MTVSIRLMLMSFALVSGTAFAESPGLVGEEPADAGADAGGPATLNTETEKPRRLARSIAVSYRSNWFLLGGFRGAKRLDHGRTEVAVQYGKSVLRGCAIQAPMCEQGDAVSLGGRRYLWTELFSPYAGTNLHYLADGIRFREVRSLLWDVDAGLHWQTRRGWGYGLGWTFFLYDRPDSGFNPALQGWLHTEIGRAF